MLYRSALGTGGKLELRPLVLLWYALQSVCECGEQRGSCEDCSRGAGLGTSLWAGAAVCLCTECCEMLSSVLGEAEA